jgi:hypothetical protein
MNNYIEPSVIRTGSGVLFVPDNDIVALYGSCARLLGSFPDHWFGTLITDPPVKVSGADECLQFLEQTNLLRWVKPGATSIVLTNPNLGYVITDGERANYVPMSELQWRFSYEHPHSRPVEQMLPLVGITEGLILDPFMGSGTTLVAARQLGRRAVGIEVFRTYYEHAVERLYE